MFWENIPCSIESPILHCFNLAWTKNSPSQTFMVCTSYLQDAIEGMEYQTLSIADLEKRTNGSCQQSCRVSSRSEL
jgi:hypothetical protein